MILLKKIFLEANGVVNRVVYVYMFHSV
uniref:Uncharacterized protein n=1 Tax=Anguilla anguilla TaxID=7936 RepID=A0A0E9T403_ANGAN